MGHLFSTYAKFLRKLTFYPLIRTSTSAYQGVRNVSFSESFVHVLNDLLNMGLWVCHSLLKGKIFIE